MRLSLPVTWLTLSSTVLSQAFVPAPQGLTEVLSEKFPGASITYKEVNGICETSDGVKSYSGYIHLPKAFLPDAASWPDDVEGHIFFWHFGMIKLLSHRQLTFQNFLSANYQYQRLAMTRTRRRPQFTWVADQDTPPSTALLCSLAISMTTPTQPL